MECDAGGRESGTARCRSIRSVEIVELRRASTRPPKRRDDTLTRHEVVDAQAPGDEEHSAEEPLVGERYERERHEEQERRNRPLEACSGEVRVAKPRRQAHAYAVHSDEVHATPRVGREPRFTAP